MFVPSTPDAEFTEKRRLRCWRNLKGQRCLFFSAGTLFPALWDVKDPVQYFSRKLGTQAHFYSARDHNAPVLVSLRRPPSAQTELQIHYISPLSSSSCLIWSGNRAATDVCSRLFIHSLFIPLIKGRLSAPTAANRADPGHFFVDASCPLTI